MTGTPLNNTIISMTKRLKEEVLIDPRLDIPRGLSNVRFVEPIIDEQFSQSIDTEIDVDQEQLVEEVDTVENNTDSSENDSGTTKLRAPSVFSVVRQQVRISPGGHTVVDVIIDVEDVFEGAEYESRTTKVNVN